jgi:hypothetical protein
MSNAKKSCRSWFSSEKMRIVLKQFRLSDFELSVGVSTALSQFGIAM